MAIADTIQSMYDNVGDVYDTITNVDLPTNKNIQNIPSTMRSSYLEIMNNGIDTIWNNWEKVEGTGETITLNSTEEAPMKINLKGNTYQYSTTGKNLLNVSSDNVYIQALNNPDITSTYDAEKNRCDFVVNSLPQQYSQAGYYYSFKTTIGKTYKVKVKWANTTGTPLANVRICSNTTGTTVVHNMTSETEYTFTASQETYYFRIWIGANVGSCYLEYAIISENGTTYEPYTGGQPSPNPDYPQAIHVVSGDNSINVCGKNLFDGGDTTTTNGITFTKHSDGSYDIVGTATSAAYILNYVPLAESGIVNGETYTISSNQNLTGLEIRIESYNGNTWLRATLGGLITFPKTHSADVTGATRVRFGLFVSSGTTINLKNVKIQLEKGTTATEYESHQGASYPINLPVENLFDKDNANYVNGWIDGTTMRLNTINGNRMFYMPCKPNTTYTISRSVITGSFRTTTYDSTPFPTVTSSNVDYTVPTVIQNNSGTTLTITTNANAKYLVVHYGKIEDTNLNETLATIQVEYGSKQNSYTPYGTTPIELCKIGDYQDSIKKSTGKNLCNGINQNVYLNNATNQCGVADNNSGLYIQVSGGNYTISTTKTQERYRVACSNNEPSGVAQTAYVGKNKDNTSNSITIDTTGYSYLIVNATDLSAIQIEKGSSSSSFEPYGKVWCLNKQIGKVVLNGSESGWSYPSANRFNLDGIINDYLKENDIASYYSNYYKRYQQTSTNALFNSLVANVNYGFNLSSTGQPNYTLRIKDTRYTTVNDFKTWLSTHNTIVYYVLATPTYTEITDTTLQQQLNALEKAKSYNSQTNLTQTNDDKPFILDVTALKQLTQ